MSIRQARSSYGKALSLQLADDLVNNLTTIRQCAEARGDPGLVDLNRALKQARKLRRRIRSQARYAVLIKKAFQVIVFLVAVARRVYALLNNFRKSHLAVYLLPQEHFYLEITTFPDCHTILYRPNP